MILLFSHQLTVSQKEDAVKNWDIQHFIVLPDDLQKLWSNIDPDLESLNDYLEPIRTFVKNSANEEDIVLIQGDFGACYNLIEHTKFNNLVPVYATTKRLVEEYIKNGQSIKKSIFEHRRFRRYE